MWGMPALIRQSGIWEISEKNNEIMIFIFWRHEPRYLQPSLETKKKHLLMLQSRGGGSQR